MNHNACRYDASGSSIDGSRSGPCMDPYYYSQVLRLDWPLIDIWSLLIDACRPLLCSIGRPLVGDRDEARSRRRGWMGRVMRPCHRHPLGPVQAGRLAAGVCYMRRCRVVQRRHACIVSMSSGAAPITVLRFRRRSARILRVELSMYVQYVAVGYGLVVSTPRPCPLSAGTRRARVHPDPPGGGARQLVDVVACSCFVF